MTTPLPQSHPVEPGGSAAPSPQETPSGPVRADAPTRIASDEPNFQTPDEGSQPEELTLGTRLGPYRIGARLGQGGMGAVYRAHHEHLDRPVALKVLAMQYASRAGAVARFRREMKMVARVEHPQIVRAMDAGEVDGQQYLALEYIDGEDLRACILRHGPLPVGAACEVIRQAAAALAAAHGAGLVHRDLKPSNLLLARSGDLKILDFGLARLREEDADDLELTRFGEAIGTPDYMAPEQWDDARSTDPRGDLYSLGCTLYFLLTGRPPFAGDQYRSSSAKMKAHLTVPAPPLSASRSDIPAAVDAIYQKLLAKEPADRFESAAALAEILRPHASAIPGDLTDLDPGSARQVPLEETAAGSARVRGPQTRSAERSVDPQSASLFADRQRRLAVAVAAVMLSLLVVAFWFTRPPGRPLNSAPPPRSMNDDSTPSGQGAIAASQFDDVPAGRAVDLLPLMSSTSMGAGRVEDRRVVENILTLDATGQSPNVWINFPGVQGTDFTIRAEARVSNPRDMGCLKFIYMSNDNPELFLLCCTDDSEPTLWIDGSKRMRREEDGIPLRRLEAGEFVDLAFTVQGDRIRLFLDGRQIAESPRESRYPGYVALGALGWKCELRNPRTIFHPL